MHLYYALNLNKNNVVFLGGNAAGPKSAEYEECTFINVNGLKRQKYCIYIRRIIIISFAQIVRGNENH